MAGRDLLLISHLDCRYYANQRTHHLARALAGGQDRVTVIYRKYTQPEGAAARRRAFLSMHLETLEEDGIRYVGVDPLFDLSVRGFSGSGGAAAATGAPAPGMSAELKGLAGYVLEQSLRWWFLWAALRERRRWGVVVAEGVWALSAALALRRLGRAAAVVCDDYDFTPGGYNRSRLRRRWVAATENRLLRRADRVVCVGEMLARRREADCGCRPEVIPNGVDYEAFAPAAGKPPHPPTLIYVGGLEYWTGLDLALDALPGLRARFPELRLRIVGYGDPAYGAHLRRRIREEGLEEAVEWVGRVAYEALPEQLATADIGLAMFEPNDLRRYAFSLKVVEYMAAGVVPVATRDTQSAALALAHGAGVEAGYDARSLEQAVAGLLADPARLKALGERGNRQARAYRWPDLTRRFGELVAELGG